jgi:hypothetical protein
VADRLVGVAPDVIRYHQKRVELAYRTGDRAPLLQAYLSSATLWPGRATDKAAVYNRVRSDRRQHPRPRGARRLAEPVDEARVPRLRPPPAAGARLCRPPRAPATAGMTPASWISAP